MSGRIFILPLLALPIALLAGCGGDAAQEAPAYPSHQQPYPGMYPQPPGTFSAVPPPPPPAPAPKAAEDLVLNRDLTTVDGALIALGADEQLVTIYLDQPGGDQAHNRSRCDRVCSALGSMRRSVGAICELAGEEDARCSDARGRLDGAERRVADSGCGCP